jgi:hypothetical protein
MPCARLVLRAFLSVVAAGLVVSTAPYARAADAKVIDDFESLTDWTAVASPGVEVEIAQDTGASGFGMRVDFDFHGSHGFLIVRKPIKLELPKNYAFSFRIRGQAPPNNVEFKLVDPTGSNVWRRTLRNFEFPESWDQIVIKKSRIDFAWGPDGSELKRIGAIEIALAAGTGGRGSVWIDDLELEPREPSAAVSAPFELRASTNEPDTSPQLMIDGDPTTEWHSGTLSNDQWVLLDFGASREYGGLILDWDPQDFAKVYEVQVSDDGEHWKAAYRSSRGNGRRDYVYLPDGESRYLRLALEESSRGQGYGIVELILEPVRFSKSINSFFEAIAAEAPPGMYPKYLLQRQSYWTVIGVAGDDREALINEEGMIEGGDRSFSLEPFLYGKDGLITWNDVDITQSLEDDYLPFPSVQWKRTGVTMTISAFASGHAGASTVYATYAIRNTGEEPQNLRLFLAIRPFQVSPPWQALNMVGGATKIHDLEYDGERVLVNGADNVVPLVRAQHFGAAAFEQGAISEYLRTAELPPDAWAHDPFGHASGALEYELRLEPGEEHEIPIALPMYRREDAPAVPATVDAALALVRTEHTSALERWRTILGRVELDLPPEAERLVDTLKSTLAYVEINRDGPAIQPGSRAYERSWIRDGALTSVALLEMGFTKQVRNFVEWFAGYQFPNGRIPCCIDQNGPDSVPEHDSNGELIYVLMEYYRFTHDVGFLSDMWPTVVRAVAYLVSLRAQRMTPDYESEAKRGYYGILPQSISHEGYSSQPVHAYWDDFFALRGLYDAAAMAKVVGDADHAREYADVFTDFREKLKASIEHTMAAHDIDYVPGSVELGDFDATSTAIAVLTGEPLRAVPDDALRTTFDEYWKYFSDRRDGEIDWQAYTPYELRNVQALIRLGMKSEALAVLKWIVDDERPKAWNQWAEIAWRDPTEPRFIGDMPHTWAASAFVSSLRTMLVYERAADDALVLAAGVPRSWLDRPEGITAKRMPTHYGPLSYSMRLETPEDGSPATLHVGISGDLVVPPGGIVVRSPLSRDVTGVTVNGQPLDTFDAHEAMVREFPADVVFTY